MASKSYFCVVCPAQIFRTRKELKTHCSEFHKVGKIPCPQCKVEIKTIKNFKRHLQIHQSNRNRRFKCTEDQCDKSFHTAFEVEQHVARNHSAERPFPCPIQCGKCFKTKEDANQHLLSHTKEKPYKCEQCDRSFGQKAHLNRHTKHQHTLPDAKPHECNQCGTRFKKTGNLKKHIHRIHTTRTKTFLCADCPMKFFSEGALNLHSETHNPERKVVDCYFCHKILTRQSITENHLRTHTNEKPFFCLEKECNYFSTHASNFYRHMKTNHYKSEKKYSCYFCSATFIRNDVIVKHRFFCEICSYSSYRSEDLKKHNKRKHTITG